MRQHRWTGESKTSGKKAETRIAQKQQSDVDMDAAEGLLKRYFRVAAKPILLVLLFYVVVIWLCYFFWFITPYPEIFFVDPRMPPEIRVQQMEIVKSFGSFLNNILQWNFGVQFSQSMAPVLPELLWRARNTLALIGLSTATSILAGALITAVASICKPKKPRPLIFAHFSKSFLYALTPFIAIIFIYLFVLQLKLLPRAGLSSLGFIGTPTEIMMNILFHLVLPVLTITFVVAIRSAMIIWSSASALNTKNPWKIFLFSITTIDFTFMVSAAFFVESLYSFPGLGQWFIRSLSDSNHPVVIASFMALLAIAIGLGAISSFLDFLQVNTGMRKDLEKVSSQFSEIETQSNKRPHTKNRFTAYFKKKSSIAGLTIVSFFIILAVAAPLLTPYRPISQFYGYQKLANRHAMPAWMTMFPEYHDYNPTLVTTFEPENVELINYAGPIEVNLDNLTFNFNPEPDGAVSQKALATIFVGNLTYEYAPPPAFTMHISYRMYFNRTQLKVYFIIQNYTANPLWEEWFKNASKAEMLVNTYTPPAMPIAGLMINQTIDDLHIDSYINFPRRPVMSSLYKPEKLWGGTPDPAKIIFSEKGVYGLQVMFEFINMRDPQTGSFEGSYAELHLEKAGLTIWGEIYGLLGTDSMGQDVWTELVYGSRTIILMSFAFSALAVVLGLPFGILAGRFKGWTDNIVMTAAETFLAVPVIPLLLIVSRYQYPFQTESLLVLFWFLPAITIIGFRNAYLTNSMPNKPKKNEVYALLKYSLANFFLTAISVSLILTSIDFMGFGDPNSSTWGRMLYNAYQLGGLSAWWVSLVPIGFFFLLIIGLFLIGSSLDEA